MASAGPGAAAVPGGVELFGLWLEPELPAAEAAAAGDPSSNISAASGAAAPMASAGAAAVPGGVEFGEPELPAAEAAAASDPSSGNLSAAWHSFSDAPAWAAALDTQARKTITMELAKHLGFPVMPLDAKPVLPAAPADGAKRARRGNGKATAQPRAESVVASASQSGDSDDAGPVSQQARRKGQRRAAELQKR